MRSSETAGRHPLVLLLAAAAVSCVLISHTWGVAASLRPVVTRVAGIGIGSLSSDGDVIGLFGEGCFVPSEPHAGGRYFTNTQRSLTLHVVLGVDRTIDAVVLERGLRLPPECGPETRPAVATPLLDQHPPVDQAIRLGISPSDLVQLLGEPDAVSEDGATSVSTYRWSAADAPEAAIPFELRCEFEADSLRAITLVSRV